MRNGHLTHGLASRRARNADLRAIGEEPVPGRYAGVKRRARWLKRIAALPVPVDPERHLHPRHRRTPILPPSEEFWPAWDAREFAEVYS